MIEPPAEVDGVDWQAAYGALGMLMCPWRLGIGICDQGCRDEPQCQTCEPDDGWAAELRRAVGPA